MDTELRKVAPCLTVECVKIVRVAFFRGRQLALGLIVATALAGCGGSDSDDESDEFVRQVDALCADARPELAEINAAVIRARDAARAGRVSARETFGTFATLLRRAGTITDRFEAQLRSIEVPSGEEEFHAALLESVERGSANVREQVSAAEDEDAVRLRELSTEGSLIQSERTGLIAGHGGFRECAQDAGG